MIGYLRLLVILFTIHYSLFALSRSIPTINAEKAHEAAREQVIWKERLCPFSTLARDFLQSVYGKTSYKGLSAEQVVYGWMLRPDAWKDEAMIYIPDKDLRSQLNIEGDYAKFSQLFDDTLGYRLNSLGKDLPPRMRQLMKESPAAVELDEKVGMIILLTQGKLIQPRPQDMEALPGWRVELEILWNKLPAWSGLLAIFIFFLLVFLLYSKKRSTFAP